MKSKPLPVSRARNLLHDHPLLRKCAVHGKNRKVERRDGRMALRRELG